MKTTSEELTVFVQVVENGSFSRAAEQLAMANSAVSRVVKRLEEKLGVNLINRTTRQLRLTEEGSQYFRRVQKILQEMAAAEAEMLAAHEVPQGGLRVAFCYADGVTSACAIGSEIQRTLSAYPTFARFFRRLYQSD